MSLPLRDPSTCHYDQISLGEVMLRRDHPSRRAYGNQERLERHLLA